MCCERVNLIINDIHIYAKERAARFGYFIYSKGLVGLLGLCKHFLLRPVNFRNRYVHTYVLCTILI